MNLHTETPFENEVCEYLAEQGWLYADKDAADYDRVLALYPPDVIAWVRQTDPKAWETLAKNHGTAAETTLLKRLREFLNERGTLDVIRHGFDALGLRKTLRMAQFKPAMAMNPDITQRYEANRLRVVRQVHYSAHHENSIDLVLFLNGIPIATVELKTDFTQSIDDAVYQYKKDRDPRPKGRTPEPLLAFPSGALVHFAVKEDTFVLDFVNDPEQILAAFKTYFTTAQLSDVTDPNIILKLRSKLDATGYYDDYEIERVVAVELDPKAKPSQLKSAIEPVANRLLNKFAAAKASRNQALANKQDAAAQAAKDVMDLLILFRTDITTYLRAYTFLSQIFDYANTDFEKRAIFFRYLVRLLKFGREREGIDLSQITLTHHRLKRSDPRALPLSDKDAPKLKPVTEAGSGQVREKQTAYLNELIAKLNEIFGSDTTDGDQLSFVNTLGEKTLESKRLQQQAASNTQEQFNSSPDLTQEIIEAVMETMDVQQELSARALNSTEVRDGVKHWLLNYFKLYEKLRDRAATA